jgi:hypothetical protein
VPDQLALISPRPLLGAGRFNAFGNADTLDFAGLANRVPLLFQRIAPEHVIVATIRVNHPGALGGDGMTQFGRALHALNIDIIGANSSPAKGRVERAHKTLQDRLVKELRLAGVRTLAEGNALLPTFIADYNASFAKPAANKKDLHRPFAWKEERTLSRALTLQYDKVLFILEPGEQAKAAIGKRVTVFDYPDGRLLIRYRSSPARNGR